MNKTPLVILLSLALYGCNEDSIIQETVRSNLKDPDSAKFEKLFVSKDGTYACINWNARNGFGGYGGWATAELKHVAGTWVIAKMQGLDFNCNDDAVALSKKIDIAKEEAMQNAIGWIKDARNLPADTMHYADLPEDCRRKVISYVIRVEDAIRTPVLSSGVEEAKAKEVKLKSELQEGICSES
ncbi:hypothetical protein SOX05_14800 [Pseudomonas putida]|nr:hypothetical protein [Pseudomonas putida]MDY4320735.1 hypothetical protein [Pseudomonas putida]MDY4354166.1 hypothetical protein [Pseudomonas putida]